MTELDIIVPVFNENIEIVLNLVARLRSELGSRDEVTIFVVDDGSESKFNLCRKVRRRGLQERRTPLGGTARLAQGALHSVLHGRLGE